jgi:N-acetylglucosaminyl-diphospho-decaprenol L-rhamnosyltransferase
MQKEIDLSIVIVNWNVRELLRQCLNSILETAAEFPVNFEIIIVDCASEDGSAEMVRREFPRVQLIASGENLGYAAGNNLGISRANGRTILVLNPDTLIIGDALTRLLSYLEANPAVGVVGPQLHYADGSLQSTRRRFPDRALAFLESTLLGQIFPGCRRLRRFAMLDSDPNITQPVDWLVGAALLFRREVWQQTGGFDTTFFMYFEETDFCHRAKDKGWEIHYLPQAQIIHYEGKSSEQVKAMRAIRFQRSKIRYYRKYYGAFFAACLRGYLLLNYLCQWALEGGKWLLGHKRALRAGNMAEYWQVIRSGL